MRAKLEQWQDQAGKFYFYIVLILLSIFTILFGYSSVGTQQYDFQVNQVSPVTIQAPTTVQDEEQTNRNREQARKNVADVYVFQPSVREEQLDSFDYFMQGIRDVRKQKIKKEDVAKMIENHPWIKEYVSLDEASDNREGSEIPFAQLTISEKLIVYLAHVEMNMSDLDKEIVTQIPRESVAFLLETDDETLTQVSEAVRTVLDTLLSNAIYDHEISQVYAQANTLLDDMNLSFEIREVSRSLLINRLVPTMVYSEEETEAQREQAANEVMPSYILQGQVIVQEGHLITADAIRQLDLFGYLDKGRVSKAVYGFYALVLVHAIVLIYYLSDGLKWTQEIIARANRHITVYTFAFLGLLFILKVLILLQGNDVEHLLFLCPVYMLPILVGPYAGRGLSVIGSIFFNLFAHYMVSNSTGFDLTLLTAYYLFSSLIGFFSLYKGGNRGLSRQIFLEVFVWQLIVIVPLMILLNYSFRGEGFWSVILMITLNTLVAGLAYYVLNPYWEALFSDHSTLELNNLSNLNNPLLMMLSEKAPGTYHHSMMVATLSSNAVTAIGGNDLLARVGSYYHDVGKTVHPLFFTENIPDNMESPHKKLSPEESAKIIISHVSEGERILKEHNFPQSIIDICLQHHGTTLVKYFYHEAKQSGEPVDEADFRYPGPKPQTKEAAVIHIADSVEAASRSLDNYELETITALVDSIIKDKWEQNQFSDSGLTFHELKIVRERLISNISGMYHTRVSYPKD